MRHLLALFFVALLVVSASSWAQSIPSALDADQSSESTDANSNRLADSVRERVQGPIDAKDIAAANSLAQSLPVTDWLGPMAPVALSPFFGMTVLSGLALYGPEWVIDNALLGAAGVLKNQAVFVVFLMLTLLTSLPRLSKVSKPFAQAVDQLETYSVIVILMVIKFMADMGTSENTEVAMVQLGIFSVTANTLLSIAMIINVIVINSVKFFFEFLVWLTPVPALDAAFEFANKGICGLLMSLYAFSPTLATIVNLVLLFVAAIVFRWMSRRVRFYRTMVVDPILSRLWPAYGVPKSSSITVFPKSELGPFKAKSRLSLSPTDDGWKLTETGWMGTQSLDLSSSANPTLHLGWVMHTIELVVEDQTHALTLSRRYDKNLEKVASEMQVEIATAQSEAKKNAKGSHNQLAGEFA